MNYEIIAPSKKVLLAFNLFYLIVNNTETILCKINYYYKF